MKTRSTTSGLFAKNFSRSLYHTKRRLVGEHKILFGLRNRRRRLHEAALEDVLDGDDVGDNQPLSDALGDIQQKAIENQNQEIKLQKLIDKHSRQTNDIIIGWVEKLDEFIRFVNDPMNESSIKSIIDSATPDSVFDKIKISESKTLTRVAQAVSSLEQALRSYVVGGLVDDNKNGIPDSIEKDFDEEIEDVDEDNF